MTPVGAAPPAEEELLAADAEDEADDDADEAAEPVRVVCVVMTLVPSVLVWCLPDEVLLPVTVLLTTVAVPLPGTSSVWICEGSFVNQPGVWPALNSEATCV